MSHKHTTTLDPKERLLRTEHRSDSRSRSHSRTRFHRSSHDTDPLLSNLSPTSTLEALSYTDFQPAETRKASSELRDSIASASSSERALGVRAASAAKKLKEWHAEVAGWGWPGPAEQKNGFEVPSGEDLVKGHGDTELGARGAHGHDHLVAPVKEQEYWGSLPRHTVEEYEERIEVIADGMEALDVGELKSHVLEAHLPSRSRSASTSQQREARLGKASHNHLDDFTAVITATILQALPYVARLNILLHTWSVRIVVLRQVPGFLRALEDAGTAVTSGWSTISASGSSTPVQGTGISRDAFDVMQPILEDRLTAAGQRLDRMLDALEGREDTVPKQWIDDMEVLEGDYSNWVVEAEKKVLDNELRQYRNVNDHLESKRQPAIRKELAQNSPSPSNPSPVIENISTENLPRGDRQDPFNEVQPSQQVSEMLNLSAVTEEISGPSAINFRPSDEESSILQHSDKEIPGAGRNGVVQDEAVVPPAKAKSMSPEYSPSPAAAASSEPPSTANGLVSSNNPDVLENPVSTKEQQISTSSYVLEDHQPEGSEASAGREHWKPELDDSEQSVGLSHQADSRLPIDHQDSKEPQPVQEVQPWILTPEPSPPASFKPSSSEFTQNTLQMDGTSEDSASQTILEKHGNESLSDAFDNHLITKASAYNGDSIDFPRSTMLAKPTNTNNPGMLSDDSNISAPKEDTPSLSPNHFTETKSDPSVDNTTSLLMPGSWDEEGVDIGAAEDLGKVQSPSIDINGHKTLMKPGTEIVSPPQDNPGKDNHTHNADSTTIEDNPGRPTALTLPSHIIHADRSTSSDNSQPGSATSDVYSNASSPEIRDARAAQSFGKPVEVVSPIRLSDKRSHDQLNSDTWSPSQQSVRASHDLPRQSDLHVSTTPVLQRNRGSSFALEPTIHEDPVSRHNADLSLGDDKDIEMRRASVASIEVLSRNEVKSINVRRRSGNYTSPLSTPSGPLLEPSGLRTPTSSLRRVHPTDASQDDAQYDTPLSPIGSTFNEDLSPLARKSNQQYEEPNARKTTPTSLSVPKRPAKPTASPIRSQDLRARPWRRGASEPLSNDTNRASKPTQLYSPTKSTEDQLEEKISSILTTIPARIRLTSGPDANAPEVVRPRSLSGTKRPDILSPAMRSSRNSSEGPSLTLAPAYTKSSPSSASPGDPEIRLYHLHQAGKDVPIKLYVRLVGEYGERVMVRVGGGWADLGEYLKEYANHHGRRSVSDGRFEIKGLPHGQSTSSVTTLASLSTTPTSRPGSALGRPASALSVRKSRFASLPSTPDQPFTGSNDMTPGSTDSHNTSVRPSSRSSWTGEDAPLGLAGPKSRRIDVSPGKQAWVDGMMEQAKRASAERRKPEEGFFGDLGKAGGTKRVFMRSSKEV